MIIVPYLLSDSGAQRAPATETEDVDVIHRFMEYSLIPIYKVTLLRTIDEEGVEIYRVHMEMVWLGDEEKVEPTVGSTNSAQFDLYRYSNESTRKRFCGFDISEESMKNGFQLKEPLDNDGRVLPGYRFTKAIAFKTLPGQKSVPIGAYRLIGTFPTDFFPMVGVVLASGKNDVGVTLFKNVIEFQHPEMGALSLHLSKTLKAPTTDPESLWSEMNNYMQGSEVQCPRIRSING